MKNFLLTIALFFLFGIQLNAQVSSLGFSQSAGAYVDIGNGDTVVAFSLTTATSGALTVDDSVYKNNKLPFTFNFNGTGYDFVQISSNGFITFGATFPSPTLYAPISDATAYSGVISGYARDIWGVRTISGTRTSGSNVITAVPAAHFAGLEVGRFITGAGIPGTTSVPIATIVSFDAGAGTITISENATATSSAVCLVSSGKISRVTTGSAPNRIHTIQYKGFAQFNTSTGNSNFIEFQIKLYETSNKIDVVYGNVSNSQSIANGQVGLRGATNADFNNRTTTTDWNATTAGAVNSATATMNGAIVPASGLTFTWAPPPPPPVVTNGGSGLAASYATLEAAVTALNAATITSPVIITVNENQTAPVGGYAITAEGTSVNTIMIDGNGSTVTTNGALVAGTLSDGVFKLIGADYITLQNFVMVENPANLTIDPATNNMTEWGVALLHSSVTNGSQNNRIRNNAISLNKIYGNTFGVYSNVRHSATNVTTLEDITNNTTAPNNGNSVTTNMITNINHAVVFVGSATAANMDDGVRIGGLLPADGNNVFLYGGLAAPTAYVGYPTTIFSAIYILNVNNYVANNNQLSTVVNTLIAPRCVLVNYDAAPVIAVVNHLSQNSVSIDQAGAAAVQCITTAGVANMVGVTMNVNENNVSGCDITANITLFGIANLGGYDVLNMNNNALYENTSTATSAGFIAVTNQGAVITTINMNNNQVGTPTQNAITFGATTTAQTNCILNTQGAVGSTVNMNNNVVQGLVYNGNSGQISGVSNQSANVSTINIMNNNLGTASRDYITGTIAMTGAVLGVFNSNGQATGTLTITGNDIRRINQPVVSSGAHSYYLNQTFAGSTNISNNTFTDITANTTGAITFIANSVSRNAAAVVTVNNNSIVTGFNNPASGTGAVLFYNSFGVSPATVTETTTGNNFSNMIFTGARTISGWRVADGSGATAPTITVTNNVFNNITVGAGTTGIMTFGFSGITAPSMSTIANNTISNITGGAALNGIALASLSVNLHSNKIFNLQSTTTGTAVVSGIALTSSSTTATNIFNNFISNLTAPAGNSTTDNVRGINITSTTATSPINVVYNSIYLNASSTGTNFSSSAIFATTSATATTAALTMINNLLVNTSTPAGTGITAAYRRSSTALTNYGASSDYNDLYVGTPSANTLLFYDGTNAIQTIGDYKTLVAPRDANSISKQVFFVNPLTGDLHLTGTSNGDLQLAGTPVAGITTDIDGDPRNEVLPYMGADEASIPLPIELASFSASVSRRDVHLNWVTASEMNNAGFDVERKSEGTETWSKAAFVEGSGTTTEAKNYSYTDKGLNAGTYSYRLKQIDYNGNFEYFNLTNEVIIGVPEKYDISQNYPNPFNPVTKINFDLPFDSKVAIKVFDITGREIATLVNDIQTAGYYTVTFDAMNIASGMYFYRITAEGGSQQYVMTKKMMVIK